MAKQAEPKQVYKITVYLFNCKNHIKEGQHAEFLVQENSFSEAVKFINNIYEDCPLFDIDIISVEKVQDPLLQADIQFCEKGAE